MHRRATTCIASIRIDAALQALATTGPVPLQRVHGRVKLMKGGISGGTLASALATFEAMGRDPADFSALTMAIRFGCKALGGFLLGWLAVRAGLRGGALGCAALLAAGSAWAWLVHRVLRRR